MGQRPRLRILAAVEALDPFADFMRQGLGLSSAWATRDGPLAAEFYAFASADLVVVEPRESRNPIAAFLEVRGPGLVAFGLADGSAAGSPAAGGRPLCISGPLSKLRLVELSTPGVTLLAGNAGEFKRDVRDEALTLDHVAYVVGDIDEAVAAVETCLRISESSALGRWRFPDFKVTNAVLLFDGAYVELNQPWSDGGPFGAHYAKSKAGGMFICLRPKDLGDCLARLAIRGIKVGEPLEISGLRPGCGAPSRIGTVYGLPRRATQKLSLNIFETAWPWDLLTNTGSGPVPEVDSG
jgi:Glyoxalase/Bleomycin resistance protein/Dioxygenase superfamily